MTRSTYLETHVTLDCADDADLESVYDALADAFHGLPDSTARDVGLDIAAREVTMTFTFEGAISPDEALRRALDAARASVEKAGLGRGGDSWDLATWTVMPSPPDSAGPRC